MTNTGTGINFQIYANAIQKYGSDVVHTSITKVTSNIESDETLTDGTTASLRVFITRKNAPWTLDKAGLILGGDALMLITSTQSVKKDDKITWNGNTYRIQDILARDQIGGTVAFSSCNLFKL